MNDKQARKRLALFDLDNTLLPIDSDVSWGEFTSTIGWTDRDEFLRRNNAYYEDYKAGTLDIHDYVRFMTAAARKQGKAAALSARERYMREVIEPAIRPAALELVQRHMKSDDEVIIITATNEFVTRPIADRFGVRELIAVQLETDADGWMTGEIKGVPSFREGKVQRFQDWLAARGWRREEVEISFYSDSMNDLPLLDNADHPVAANPDERLRAVAVERGWPILELFNDHETHQ